MRPGRLARVPGPVRALVALFAISLLLVSLRTGPPVPAEESASADGSAEASSAPSSSPSSEPSSSNAGPEVSPGTVLAPATDRPVAAALPAPTSVSIPKIGLDERLVDLGIAQDGTMQVPDDPDRVGWFAGGARPGGAGPVVVAGHVDSVSGPAVFARLSELAPGDDVTLTTADGPARYVVRYVTAVSRSDFPTERVFGPTVGDTVRLITCHGSYDRGGIGYTENLVVTATRV